jgi:hypothetical protein
MVNLCDPLTPPTILYWTFNRTWQNTVYSDYLVNPKLDAGSICSESVSAAYPYFETKSTVVFVFFILCLAQLTVYIVLYGKWLGGRYFLVWAAVPRDSLEFWAWADEYKMSKFENEYQYSHP